MSLERPPIPSRFSRTHTIGADTCSEVQEFSTAAADQSPTTTRSALVSYNFVSYALNLHLLSNTVSIFLRGDNSDRSELDYRKPSPSPTLFYSSHYRCFNCWSLLWSAISALKICGWLWRGCVSGDLGSRIDLCPIISNFSDYTYYVRNTSVCLLAIICLY